MVITALAFAQSPQEDSIVRDEEGNPLYFRDQIIVKFHPDLVDTSLVNDTTIQSGLVSDFINPIALQMIIDSGYFNQGLADLQIQKIHNNMTAYDTISITRLGDTIPIPKFWSIFLVIWNDSVGMSFEDAIDTLNLMWPAIEYAHPNNIYELHVLPNDALFIAGEQAGLNPTTLFPSGGINIDPAWDLTVGTTNIRVGVYDEGINWDHSDFSQDNSGSWAQSRVQTGWDWINDVHPSTTTTLDLDGHGTAIAGIIGAIRNNDRGVAGIAGGNGATNVFGVELAAMKIMQNGSFISDDLIAKTIREGANSFNGKWGFSLNVMNHSWGGTSFPPSLQDAVRYAYRNNVVFVTSSGNTWGNTAVYPASARDEWVLKVGANDETGDRANFSTYGNSLDFIAPGVKEIYETTDALNNGTYTYNKNGTSYAAPHAAGVAALMLSYINAPSNAPNNLAPDDIENFMQRFATDITPSPASIGYDDRTGFGRINAGATLQGIRLPRFEVRHYNQNFNNNSATKIASNVQMHLISRTNGLAAGVYFGNVYEITRTFNITQPTGRTIIDVWKRNSSSTLYGNVPIIPEANCVVSSWSQTSATMRGYIFEINMNIIGQQINTTWLPSHGLKGTGKMSLTVYSEDPLASGIKTIPIDKNFARIIPNPSNGNFIIMFTLLKSTELGVEVTDVTGKVVFSQPMLMTTDGHQEIELQLQNLSAGLYICNLHTTEGSISKKLSIVK